MAERVKNASRLVFSQIIEVYILIDWDCLRLQRFYMVISKNKEVPRFQRTPDILGLLELVIRLWSSKSKKKTRGLEHHIMLNSEEQL